MDASSSPTLPAASTLSPRDPLTCLPAALQQAPVLQRLGRSFSGAEVYRVESAGQTYVLKLAARDQPLLPWRGRLHVQQLAANAGLAPRVVHADELHRAIVSEFAADKSFAAWCSDPRTRDTALTQLGQLLRRVHQLPPPASLEGSPLRERLATVAAALGPASVPAFVRDAINAVLTENPPAPDRAPVLSHNDVHPANLVFDGERVRLLDWDACAPNDPYFDLGAIALFLRLDAAASGKLLTAYTGAPVSTLPAGFTYHRRLAGVLCGSTFLKLAHERGSSDDTPAVRPTTPPSLGDVYAQLRAGTLKVDEAEGQWVFGLALINAAITT